MIEWLFCFVWVVTVKALAMCAAAARGSRLRTLGDVLLVQCFLHPLLRFELTCKGLEFFCLALPLTLTFEVVAYRELSVRRMPVPGEDPPRFSVERTPLRRIVLAVAAGGLWQFLSFPL